MFFIHWRNGGPRSPCSARTEKNIELLNGVIKCLYVRYSQAQDLAMTYNQNLSADFPQQLLAFRNIMMSKIESNATIKDLAELHIALVPDVVTVFKIFLTLPVAERSFSKLKLIKNYMYMRSNMSQDMLSGLSILNIENERARNSDLS